MIATISPWRAAHMGRCQARVLYRDPLARRAGPKELLMGLTDSRFWRGQTQEVGNTFGFAFTEEWLRLERPVAS